MISEPSVPTTVPQSNMSGSLLDEIRSKKQLKKVETQEKFGVEYSNKLKQEEKKEKEATVEIGGKNDFLSEMRKIQLKKK